jgi:hypothetical protein
MGAGLAEQSVERRVVDPAVPRPDVIEIPDINYLVHLPSPFSAVGRDGRGPVRGDDVVLYPIKRIGQIMMVIIRLDDG